MKNNLQRQIKRYLREISLLIPDSYTNKECLLNTIRKNLNDFLKKLTLCFIGSFVHLIVLLISVGQWAMHRQSGLQSS